MKSSNDAQQVKFVAHRLVNWCGTDLFSSASKKICCASFLILLIT